MLIEEYMWINSKIGMYELNEKTLWFGDKILNEKTLWFGDKILNSIIFTLVIFGIFVMVYLGVHP